MDPAALSAPVAREWTRRFEMGENAHLLARIHTRTQVTLLQWSGDVDAATEVARQLVANAYMHASTGPGPGEIGFRLAVTEDEELIIEVSDPLPEFPDFGEAVQATRAGGVREIREHGGQVSWFLPECGGKTVQARMTPAAATA